MFSTLLAPQTPDMNTAHLAYALALHAACSLLPVVWFAALAPAQCATTWTGGGLPGTDGTVHAIGSWDPDGAGPGPALRIVAGQFSRIGTIFAANIAMQDPITGSWMPVGAGLDGPVYALANGDNGDDIWVGGAFTAVGGGGAQVRGLARWSGVWQGVGGVAGGTPQVRALARDGLGNLLVGGDFSIVGTPGLSSPFAARLNFTSLLWSTLGGGLTGYVAALAQLPNGQIVAGGQTGIRVSTGTGWTATGPGSNFTGRVLALAVMPNGDLVAGGTFALGSSLGVARWDGTNWSSLGGGVSDEVRALQVMTTGDLIVGGNFLQAGGITCDGVARWNGTNWSPLGAGFPVSLSTHVNALASTPGSSAIWAGGSFPSGLGVWTGTRWSSVSGTGNGPNGRVSTCRRTANGELVIGGSFTEVGGIPCNNIARRTAAGWSPLGSGFSLGSVTAAVVHEIIELQNGDLIAVGAFSTAGGVPAAHAARWNGVAWSALGAGLPSPGMAMTSLANGDVVAGCQPAGVGLVMRWNGSQWTQIGSFGSGIPSLARMANGDLVAGSWSSLAPAEVRRWNGSQWSLLLSATLPIGVRSVNDLVPLPTGDLIALGSFSSANGVACAGMVRWSGGVWSPVGTAAPAPFSTGLCATVLPTGDLVATGIAGANAYLGRWNGTAWQSLGYPIPAASLAVAPDGSLDVGGNFVVGSSVVVAHLASVRSGCAAAAVIQGAGCIGSGGQNQLGAEQLPWIGGTAVSRATGLAANGIALGVLGVNTASIPLNVILPQGLAGCMLLAQPDLLDVQLPNNGQALLTLPIPVLPALSGAVLHQQVATLELDAAGAITAVTATNALQLTLGNW